MKTWWKDRFSTPEKARDTIASIAMVGGLIGFAMTMVALYMAQA